VIMQALFWVGVIPLITALTARWVVVETKGQDLPT
jgi:hypothetical protein